MWLPVGITSDIKAGLTFDIYGSALVAHSVNKRGAALGYKGYGYHLM
ncbi:MAG: hypothetical protein OXI96_10240 [Acidimicrobiaceae bacterium]|nr:hypothetical protein [Acidimicrobiaceae bacterium]